jgi:hypothetical protein
MTARSTGSDSVEPTTTPRTPSPSTMWTWLGDWAATVRLGPLSHQAVSRRTGARC